VKSNNTGLLRVILGTGGTIAGRSAVASDNVGYKAGEVGVGDLIGAVPPLKGFALEVEQVAQIDSKDMGLSVWLPLAERVAHHLERDEVHGVVITHGTDTLEETAWFLQSVLQPRKPVVLTCAMRPSTALVPDGPQNLLDAVVVAGIVGLTGVVAVCAGQVHSAAHVAKVHSYRMDAFDSGDAGPLGCVEEGEVRWHGALAPSVFGAAVDRARLTQLMKVKQLPKVALITSHADADGSGVRALLAWGRQRGNESIQGIVVACTGNGTVHHDLQGALLEAQEQGVRVVRATRCARGRVIPSAQALFPDSGGLSPVKARLALSLDLLTEQF
jgi:L-asparaginase